jgi:hypothetical protein
MDVSRTVHAARLLALAGLAALLWFAVSLFFGPHSASADEPSPLDPLGSVVGSLTQPLVSTVAPVVSAPVQAAAPVVQAVAPVAAQAITAAVPAPVAAAVAPVAAPVAAVVSTVTAPVAAAAAPVTAPLEPLVSAVVEPLAPAVAQVVDPLAPVVAPVTNPALDVLSPALDSLVDAPTVGPVPAEPAEFGPAVSVPATDAASNATAASAFLRLAVNGQTASSASPQGVSGIAVTSALEGDPALPVDGPLPAAPAALSGSAASGAAGGSAASADVARGFALAAARGASVTTLSDDELPSSPTFPSDTTPD